MEKAHESLKSLFQQEFVRLVAVISKRFGLQHIELAEDIVSETFLLAAETWGVRGLPANPAAWLYTVAKQKTLYQFRRRKLLDDKIMPELTARRGLDGHTTDEEWDEVSFSAQTIRDSQLQMLFAVCTPLIADEAQIGLALRILCGFGIDEIAEAFLTNKETISKRLFRAKEKLRAANVPMALPDEGELVRRLDRVLHVIYLLFNEGYYSKTQNQTLQKEVCLEAMRLGVMLTEYEPTNQPKINALMALMCFHASRFEARRGDARSDRRSAGRRSDEGSGQAGDGVLLLYEQQNEALWDTALIRQGFAYLERSLQGDELSTYHLEARIASWHCVKEDTPEKWAAILALYDQLLRVNNSPSVALNRTYALYKAEGRTAALVAAETLKLKMNHLYFMLLGELYREIDSVRATAHFHQAYALAKTSTDRQTIRQKLNALVLLT
ncbi:RNA polymerase sigma factor [Spirosoma arcticum]